MIVSQPTLDGLRTQFSLIFGENYKATEVWQPKISTEVTAAAGRSSTYGWIAQSLTLQEWLGPRVAMNLSEHVYVLTNKNFERSVEVDRNDIEDDNLGMYTSIIVPQLGEAVRKHPDQMIARMLKSKDEQGNTIVVKAFDGKALFATNHPTFAKAQFAQTYSNYSVGGMPLTADNFNTVWSTMVSYVGENGQPLSIMPNKLFVPPQLKKTALQIMQSTTAAQAVQNVAGTENVGAATVDNVLKGWADVEVLEELSDEPTVWYLADCRKPLKPFLYQKRRAPEFVSRVNPQDPKVFDQRMFTFGVDYRGNVGPTLPFLVYKAAA